MDRRWGNADLERISENIRYSLTDGKPATIPSMLRAVQELDLRGIYFFSWVATHDQGMGRFLIPEILSALNERMFPKFYFDEDADSFIRKYLNEGAKWLSYYMFLSDGSVYKRCNKLGLSVPRLSDYSQEEENLLECLVKEGASVSLIAKKLRRSKRAIKSKKDRLDVRSDKFYHWDGGQDDYIRQTFCEQQYEDIATHLGVETWQVEKRVVRLGLFKKPRQYNWSKHPNAVVYLKDNVGKMTYGEMAAHLKLRKMQVERKVQKMRVKGEF